MRVCKICGKPVRAGMTTEDGDFYAHEGDCFDTYMDREFGKHKWMVLGAGAEDGFGGYYITTDDSTPCGFYGTGIFYTEWEEEDGDPDAESYWYNHNPHEVR